MYRAHLCACTLALIASRARKPAHLEALLGASDAQRQRQRHVVAAARDGGRPLVQPPNEGVSVYIPAADGRWRCQDGAATWHLQHREQGLANENLYSSQKSGFLT